jgi:hypothetical protein
MAREAAVRLTLSNAQFVTSMKQAGDSVQSTALRGKRSMDAFGASADKVKGKVEAIGSVARTVSRHLLSLGGAFTVATSLKEAVVLQRTYRQIAFGVKDASGQMLRAADVQRVVERSAAAASQKNADMAKTFRDLADATGDVDFAKGVLTSVGTVALATGEDLGTIATAADQLHTKFGVSASGMLDSLAQVFGAAKQGGPKFSEFADVMSGAGAEMLAAGLDGKRGLDFMLGALVATDDRLKSLPKQVAGLKAVLRGLGEKGELKKLAEKIGIDPKKLINEKDAIARVRRIFGAGSKGVDALLGGMHEGEEKETMKILFVEPFQRALAEAQKSGLKGKAAIDRALLTFDQGIAAMGRASMSGAQMQRQADAERQTPEAQLTAALNTLATAMSQPAIISAINDLAKHLPKLAEHIASFISFAAEHPYLAGAGALGAKAAGGGLMDLAGNVLGEVIGGGLGAGGGAVIQKMLGRKAGGAAAGGVVGAMADAAGGIQRHHQFGMDGGITGEMLGATDDLLPHEIGKAGIKGKLGAGFMGNGVVGSAAKAIRNPWVQAAIVAGTVGAIGINRSYGNEGDVMGELQNANAAAAGGGSRQQKQAMLDRLRKARDAAAKADIGGGAMDWFARGVTGVDTRKQGNDAIWDATQTILKLQEDLKKPQPAPSSGGHVVRLEEQNIVGRAKEDARAIGQATAAALSSRVQDVRIINIGEMTVRGGSPFTPRPGPMVPGKLGPGGGV